MANDSIQDRVERFRTRNEGVWPTPHPRDTLHFVQSETMEVAEWMIRNGYEMKEGYVRAHQLSDDDTIATELAQVQIMLCTLATQLHVDLDVAVSYALGKIRSMALKREEARKNPNPIERITPSDILRGFGG